MVSEASMRGCAAAKSSSFVGIIALGATIALAGFFSTNVSAQSNVKAQICRPSAGLTISAPQSDSVVTSPDVVLKGTVAQAAQIEVSIGDVFDSVIPLSAGQTSFESTVQIHQGTHTIKLTAIDSCGGDNTDSSVVVTFTPPPSRGSTGNSTDTAVEGTGGVAIGVDQTAEVKEFNPGGLLPAPLANSLNGALRWLNIAPGDNSSEGLSQLSLGRAAVITLGVYMSFIGVAQTITTAVAATPLFHRVERPERLRVAGRALRIVGLVLIVAAFVV